MRSVERAESEERGEERRQEERRVEVRSEEHGGTKDSVEGMR